MVSFYAYLNYHPINDYVVDMNDVWKWLGFGRKEECKRILVKNFKQDLDYKVISEDTKENLAPQVGGASQNTKKHGGQNKEQILMNLKTISNNFTKDEDYKLVIIPREKP